MAHYAIGDIQGCFDELTLLLAKIGFNHGTDTPLVGRRYCQSRPEVIGKP